MEILLKYLQRAYSEKELDEWHLWMNTKNREDNSFMDKLAKEHEWIKQVFWHREEYPNNLQNRWTDICHFFPIDSTDGDSIYLRLDDDIVWMEKGAISSMFDFRLQNPEYFLILGNIVNNGIISHIHQRFGAVGREEGINYYNCLDSIGWAKPEYAGLVHSAFLENLQKGELQKYKFPRWELWDCERISVNVACWLGRDFAKFNGVIGKLEELDLSENIPKREQQMNCINGQALFVHYAFYTQRDYLDNRTDALKRYALLADGE